MSTTFFLKMMPDSFTKSMLPSSFWKAFWSMPYKMLTMPGKKTPHIIPDAEFNNFRRIIDTGNATFINRPLRKGDKVRITDGALAGCMAFVQRIQGKKVIIGNELLYIGGATIEVDRESLEFVREGRKC